MWSTYWGGAGGDESWDIAVDNSNNIYITSQTQSSNITTLPFGAVSYYAQPNKSGFLDGFILTLNSNLVPLWMTYFGGNGNETLQGLTLNGNDLYVVGIASQNFILEDQLGAYFQNSISSIDIHCTISKFSVQEITTSTQEISYQPDLFTVYPNPATHFIKIGSLDYITNLVLYDVAGRVVLSQNKLNTSTYQLNIQSYHSGIYWLKVITNKGQYAYQKIIIQ